MNVIGCASIPVAVIKMVIGGMDKEGSQINLREKPYSEGKSFWIPVSKSVAEKLQIGNEVTIACVPTKDLEYAHEALAVKLRLSENSSRVIYDRANYSNLFF